MKDVLEIRFPVEGARVLPLTYAYPLYGALCAVVPLLHDNDAVQVRRLTEIKRDAHLEKKGWIELGRDTELRLRAPADMIPSIAALSQETIGVMGALIVLGVPKVSSLRPRHRLISEIVVISHGKAAMADGRGMSAEALFAYTLGRQIETAGVSARLSGIGPRRHVHVKQMRQYGFPVRLSGLSEAGSLAIQAGGIGGRGHYGAGWFDPAEGVEP